MDKCPSLGQCDSIDKVYDSRVGLLYTVISALRNMTEQLAGGSCGGKYFVICFFMRKILPILSFTFTKIKLI